MGNANSKQLSSSPDPIVFTNPAAAANVSIRFNESLLRQLEANANANDQQQPSPPSSPTSQEDDASAHHVTPTTATMAGPTPAQLEALIQDEVNRRVAAQLEQAQLAQGVRADHRSDLDSQTALREADELLHRLGRISLPTPEPNMECVAAQEQLAACFKANPGRSLDCWREVEQFKASLKKVQRDFMETASLL